MKLDLSLEALLFFKNEPISIKKIATTLGKSEEEITEALALVETTYAERGIRLMRNGNEVMFATAPEASVLIEKITKDELTRDLGKAGLEVLSIILYKGPVARREIDYIRGVNSNFIIRNLLIRGLIEKTESKEGERSFTYKPTFELLSFMGVSSARELPEYEKMQAKITAVQENPVLKGGDAENDILAESENKIADDNDNDHIAEINKNQDA
ncbi:SMC-Scp complex subunit ScpB [Candidatus Parcubacteria bacterium]|nr:SMC-Scp complex subunit ScpB [Candidatus Parcubacteria bacterium]